MPAGARDRQLSRTPLQRIAANTAWLLGGKGFGAVCALLYLAILTRSLGLRDFGHFALIFGMAQALIGIAGFQTWRIVVRYGAAHVHAGDWRNFGRLGVLCGALDAVSAVLGSIIGFVVIYGFGDLLEINTEYRDAAFWFSCAMVFALVSAPTGIVRALDRFDVSVYVEAIVPSGRLLAAVAIWFTGPSLVKFLFAWAAIDLLEAALYWTVARRLSPERLRLGYLREWRETLRANPGVERFFWITSATSTLDAVMRHGPLLAVGAFAGTKAAGLYRLANQLTNALSKVSGLLTRTVYPEMARARIASAASEFRRLTLQTSAIAAVAGAMVVSVALLAGDELLVLVGGEAFASGKVILVPLAVAASLDLASVAFEPVLHATGRARHALRARIASLVTLVAAMVLLAPGGHAEGTAWAVAAASLVSYVVMGVMARVALYRLEPRVKPEAEADTLLPEPQRDG